jgi:hypothetical protein
MHFFSTAKRSAQEKPRSNKALHPILCRIKQAAFSRSRGQKLNWLSMPIDPLNSAKNRRALIREINQKHGFAI